MLLIWLRRSAWVRRISPAGFLLMAGPGGLALLGLACGFALGWRVTSLEAERAYTALGAYVAGVLLLSAPAAWALEWARGRRAGREG